MFEFPKQGGANLTDLSPSAMHLLKTIAVLPPAYKPTVGWTRDFYNECIVKLEEKQEEWIDVLKQLKECNAFMPYSDFTMLNQELFLIDSSILDGMEDAEKDEYLLLAFRYALSMKQKYDKMDEFPYGIHPSLYMMFILATIGMTYVSHNFIDMSDEEIEEYRTNVDHYLGFLTCEELLALASLCASWARMVALNNFVDILPVCYDEMFNLLDYTQEKWGLEAVIETKQLHMVIAFDELQGAGYEEIVMEYALDYYGELKVYAMSHPESEMAWDCFASAGAHVITSYLLQMKSHKAEEYAEEMIKISKLQKVKDNEARFKLEFLFTQLLELCKAGI